MKWQLWLGMLDTELECALQRHTAGMVEAGENLCLLDGESSLLLGSAKGYAPGKEVPNPGLLEV